MRKRNRYESYGWGGFAPYVPVAERRAQAAKEVAKLRKKGHPVSPIVLEGRTIATTFWGKAWCRNLEAYSDYANRVPRGRTYVRNGSVIDLQIGPGRVTGLVSGSSIYSIELTIRPVDRERWRELCDDCAGSIDSLVELLQGRLSKGVMERLCRQRVGLFPEPREIKLSCSCPDVAGMCKHVAAVLYGVGARLDTQPELLFALRGVEAAELLSRVGGDLPQPTPRPEDSRRLDVDDLSGLFGVELAASEPVAARAAPSTTPAPSKPAAVSRPGDPPKDAERLLAHLRACGPEGASTRELLHVDPSRSHAELKRLLDDLRAQGRVALEGRTRAARWRLPSATPKKRRNT